MRSWEIMMESFIVIVVDILRKLRMEVEKMDTLSNAEREQLLKACKDENIDESAMIVRLIRQFLSRSKLP
jgi:phosphopantothenate synthetase